MAPDKNLGGRPRLEDTASHALRMQRMLMQLRSALPHTSMVTGKPLTIRALACWIYWRDQEHPPSARHGVVPPPAHADRIALLRAQAEQEVHRTVLGRVDGYIGAVHRGQKLHGVRLRAERAYSRGSFRVGGLPGFYWGDAAVPIGDSPGEPSMKMVRTVMDAVEVVDLSISDLQVGRARHAAVVEEITVAERVSELLGEDGSAERQLRRHLQRAREFEFVHLAAHPGCDGVAATGKRLSPGALERLYRGGAAA